MRTAKLLRFYPGLSLESAWALEGEEAEMLIQAQSRIQAEEALHLIQIASFPYMKPEQQEKVHRSYFKQLNPEMFEKPKEHTSEEFYRRLLSGRR